MDDNEKQKLTLKPRSYTETVKSNVLNLGTTLKRGATNLISGILSPLAALTGCTYYTADFDHVKTTGNKKGNIEFYDDRRIIPKGNKVYFLDPDNEHYTGQNRKVAVTAGGYDVVPNDNPERGFINMDSEKDYTTYTPKSDSSKILVYKYDPLTNNYVSVPYNSSEPIDSIYSITYKLPSSKADELYHEIYSYPGKGVKDGDKLAKKTTTDAVNIALGYKFGGKLIKRLK